VRGLAELAENTNHIERVMEICWIPVLRKVEGVMAADVHSVGLDFTPTRNRTQ
jgi:hypothetical protein